jgi:hypothetical protein
MVKMISTPPANQAGDVLYARIHSIAELCYRFTTNKKGGIPGSLTGRYRQNKKYFWLC